MIAAVLQLPSIGMSSTKLYHYVRIAHKKNVKVLVLGEYLLNSFFKELETMSVAMIKEQSEHQTKILKELSLTYAMTIIAPLIIVKKKQLYKSIVKFSPTSISYYYQQILINYPHWNEAKFFANETTFLKAPMVFSVDGFKFAVMSGFEMHVDKLWAMASSKNVDAVIVPSVSTFESAPRWKNLAQMRAFTHNCYVLRANRIGEYKENEYTWQFYGDSFLIDPSGEVVNELGNKEELMIVDLSHSEAREAKKNWGFRELNTKY
jgi:predicted amidohydrolase